METSKVKMRCGADPEVFTTDVQSGKFLSIIGEIGAGKENPFQIPDLPPGFTLQEDNVALEFGIPPAATADEFVHHIQTVMQAGLSKLPGRAFSKLSCTIFPKDQMEDPMAFIFGCEPDFNAWTGQQNPRPQPPHPFLRSAGGHVHIETDLDKKDVGRAFDLFCVVPSLFMDDSKDRRKLYGRAGSIRYKPYGVECRALSNFWIFDEKHIRWVWRNTERALDFAANKAELLNIYGTSIQPAINNNDLELAGQLVKQFDLEVI
jgi:Phage phiEco32-like COOH.NH2 ligase-type 2